MAITKASSNAVAAATKGDLVVGSATNDSSVLAVGSAAQVLTVDSSTATGLKWATPAAGGGITQISSATPSGATYSVSGLGGYKQLIIVFEQVVSNSGVGQNVTMRFNGNGGSDYIYRFLNTSATTVSAQESNTDTSMPVANLLSSTSGNSTLTGVINVYDYSSTSIKAGTISVGNRSAGSASVSKIGTFAYAQASAITQFDLIIAGGAAFSGGTVIIYGVN
jgi:hypothetical protein